MPIDAPDHHLVDRVEGLAEVVADVHPLARREAVGLQDHAQGPPQDILASLGGRPERPALAALLQLDLDARREHLARVHDPVDLLQGLGRGPAELGVADRGAALGADDERDLAREDVVLGVGGRAEDAIVGRRDARLAHQLLGEDLAPLQLGGVLAGAEDAQALAVEGVDDPVGEGLLGADDREADPLAPGELGQGAEVARLDGDVDGVEPGAGVPGCAEDPPDAGRLLQLPAEGVLTPPLADHEHFQREDSPGWIANLGMVDLALAIPTKALPFTRSGVVLPDPHARRASDLVPGAG